MAKVTVLVAHEIGYEGPAPQHELWESYKSCHISGPFRGGVGPHIMSKVEVGGMLRLIRREGWPFF